MAQQRRPIELKFHVTPEEKAIIEKKKAQIGTSCTAAYCRKMALDGYVLKLDFPELRQWSSTQRRISNNFNQLAKRVNTTNRIYEADIENMRTMLEQLWETINELMLKLATIDDAIACDRIFSICMGDKVEPRRDFIEQNAKYAENLDF